jgi:hypothetical protein
LDQLVDFAAYSEKVNRDGCGEFLNRAQLMEILDTAQPKPDVATLLQVIEFSW